MIEKLSEGYDLFRNGYFQLNRKRLEQLADKQTPEAAMISCCDSRVDPGILFDLEPGEKFIIHNVANLVPPFETKGAYHGTSAALQFAVTCLQVKKGGGVGEC
jgi:carbonic anhydrase